MIPRLLTLAVLIGFTAKHPEIGAALLAAYAVGVWTAAGIGYRTAVRTSGVGMVKGGVHRIKSGTF